VETDKNWTRHPNGTGPYLLKEWRLGEQIVLNANDHYHLGVPSVKSVRFLLTGNGITLYQSGDVDVAGVGLDDLERVQDPADPLNKDYHTGNRLLLDYLGFNTNAPPFDDANVRKAFAMAIDKNQIVSAVFKKAVPPATSILMPGLPAYDPNAKAPGFNVAEAKRLLDESKYHGAAGLPAVTIAEGGTGATAGPATAAMAEMWRQNLGVDVQIEQAQTATYFQNINEGRYQMFVLAWIMDYPDPEDILNIHFDSQSPNNNTFYKNAQVDTLLRQALTEQDQQRRIDLYRQAQQLILDDVPWLPLFFDQYHVLIKPYVQNYVIPSAIVPSLRYITLSPQ
jgi:oligopeptide transport system substrate-binding protein